LEVIKFIVDEYKKKGIKFDIVFNIMPASPLIKSFDFHKALKIFKKFKMKYPLQVFSKFPVPLEWAFSIDKKGIAKPIHESNIKKIKENTPSGRFGKKSEFIKAINFIINNKFFNGKILELDGGLII